MNNQNPIRVRATKPQSVGELKAAFNAYTASAQGGGQPASQPPAPAHQFQGQQPPQQQPWGQQPPQQSQQWGQPAPQQQPPQQSQQWGQPAPQQQPWGQQPQQQPQPQQWGQPQQQPQWEQPQQQPQQWGQPQQQPQWEQAQQPQQWGQQPPQQQQWGQQQPPQQWGQPAPQQDPALAEVTKQVEALANIIKGQTEAQQKAQQMAAKQELIAAKLAEQLGEGRGDIDPKELAKKLLEDFSKPAGEESNGSAPAGSIDGTIKIIEATDPTVASVLVSQQFKDYAHNTVVGVGPSGPVTLADALAGSVAKGTESSVRYAVQAARAFMTGQQQPAGHAPQPPQTIMGNGGYYAPQGYGQQSPAQPVDPRQRKNEALVLAQQLTRQTGDPSYIMEASKLL